MTRVIDFLDKYSKLENLIETHYNCGRDNCVMFLARTQEFKKYYEQLNYCREVRNVLSHNPKVEGQYLIEPSQAIIDLLDKIINLIDCPTNCYSICIKTEELLTASKDSKLLPLAKSMYFKGLSSVPILNYSRVIGVLTKSAIFSYVVQTERPIEADTVVSQLAEYTNIDKHYAFIDNDASLLQAQAIFEKAYEHNDKLAMLFVTEYGKPEDKLLGIITPWELIAKK
ncbi:MAG: hypothetical protein RR248_05865 [Clostridia bacterium]